MLKKMICRSINDDTKHILKTFPPRPDLISFHPFVTVDLTVWAHRYLVARVALNYRERCCMGWGDV